MTTARSDAENKRLLDEAMPTYEALRRGAILEDANVERLAQTLEEANKQAVAAFGTSDLAELERMMAAGQQKNTEAVDRFRGIVSKADRDVKNAGAKF